MFISSSSFDSQFSIARDAAWNVELDGQYIQLVAYVQVLLDSGPPSFGSTLRRVRKHPNMARDCSGQATFTNIDLNLFTE